jgi:cytochrome P450
MDDPDHKRLRDLVVKAFNQTAVDAMRPRITEVACGLLDDIDDPSCFDIVDAYARPLPTIAIALMLGVDTARCHDFKRWSDGKIQIQPAAHARAGGHPGSLRCCSHRLLCRGDQKASQGTSGRSDQQPDRR